MMVLQQSKRYLEVFDLKKKEETHAAANFESRTFLETGKAHRLEALDSLRGMAILGVVVVHSSQLVSTGYGLVDQLLGFGRFGVQLFYIISAITMCYMWHKRQDVKCRIRDFYVRRFFRIAPLFWIAIAIYFALSNHDLGQWAFRIILNVFFLNGFSPSAINSVVPGAWSIAVEMTFYMIFPFVVLKLKDKEILYLVAAIAIWVFYTFLFSEWLMGYLLDNNIVNSFGQAREFVYMIFPNQAPIFFIGCCIYFAAKQRSLQRNGLMILFLWALFSVGLALVRKEIHFSFPAVYIFIGLFVYFFLRTGLKVSILEHLGRNSYAIYLSHFYFLDLFGNIFTIQRGVVPLLGTICAVMIASYLVSLCTASLIENKVHSIVNRMLADR